MAHGVVRTDLMFGTLNGVGLASIEYATKTGSGSSAVYTPADIDNGRLVILDGLKENEREIYHGITPAANSKLGQIFLVCSPELMYDERLKNLDEFYNKAGVPARGYMLHTGDVYSVTADALDGVTTSTKVGDLVELQADTKAKVVTSATSGSTTIGKIIAIEVVGSYTYYVIRID